MKAEGPTVTRRSRVGEELLLEETTQQAHRQQEVLLTWHPVPAIERNPPAWNHAVEVRMVKEVFGLEIQTTYIPAE